MTAITSPAWSPQKQEQIALKMIRGQQRAAKRREARKVRAWVGDLREAIAETKALNPDCTCGLHKVWFPEQLRALGGGCTMPAFACPRLVSVRNRVDEPPVLKHHSSYRAVFR